MLYRLCEACLSICSGLRDIGISKFVYVQDWILAILTEIVQDWTPILVQDWIFGSGLDRYKLIFIYISYLQILRKCPH